MAKNTLKYSIEHCKTAARESAITWGIDPALVFSLIETESDWNPWAARYEPAFYRRYIENLKVKKFGYISVDTEKMLRSTSFGLMQIMGQVARELGYHGTFLNNLCDPSVGTYFGCKRLKKALSRKDGNVERALLDYNGGGDKLYPERVLSHKEHYA